jgi:1-phosphatidylinositol-4-phosphate 5-kinase
LSKTANEKLSEGASGAFMFFCGKGEFIVKTIKVREARVLHTSLQQYYDYLSENSGSFLCKFYGSYSLAMFSQTFYFVVMKNIFEVGQVINERYDIKGSWVGRSADPEPPSKKTVCRHCNELFVPMKKEKCTVIVGYHEGNVVLKDNDLRAKISLEPGVGKRVLDQLMKDGDLLGKLGVLDYSLLIGVKKYKFDLNLSDQDVGVDTAKANYIFKGSAISGPGVYFFGIVDFLQDWNMKKQAERMFKIYIKRKSPAGLSVMQPEKYMKRFQKKMEELFDVEEDVHGISATVSSARSGGAVTVLGNKANLLSVAQQVQPTSSDGSTVLKSDSVAVGSLSVASRVFDSVDSYDSWEKVEIHASGTSPELKPRRAPLDSPIYSSNDHAVVFDRLNPSDEI